jgi:hypothetical protein
MEVDEILVERGKRYGRFSGHALISQEIKSVLMRSPSFKDMNVSQMESMSMIVHKIARIVNGDPNYIDSWADIAGYAQLIVKQLEGEDP